MASSIVKSAAQQLGNLMVEEAKYLYQVSDKIENLQTELAWMECFLRDADTQQHQEKVICMWVSQVRDLAYEAEDILERYLHEVSYHRQDGIRNTLKWVSCIIWTCDARTLHNLGSDIDNMAIRISDLTSRLQRYGIQIIKPSRSLEYNNMSREERRTYCHTIEDVVGLQKDIQQVVDQLTKTDVKVVGISGIGGLGKTTLARKVFRDKGVSEHFNNNCVWVYISKEFDRNHIFQEILIGLTKSTCPTVEGLPGEIDKVLQDKICFVVLDDMWNVDAWKSLKPAFESIFRDSRSKLLITTRNQGLVKHVDSCGYPHPLKPLSLDDSWELLRRKAFIEHESKDDDVQVKHEKEQLGREMLKHCEGLPLAILALGGILSTKTTILQWKDVQKNIISYLMSVDQGSGHGRILEVLELSYHDLPFYLKPCFLYLGNFPEDYQIHTQRLYQLWDAEGLLITVDGGTSYDVGERYLSELVQRSMVQVEKKWPSGMIKYCRVHEVMRDMCLRKCEEVNFHNIMECSYSDIKSTISMVASRCIENKRIRHLVVHGQEDSVVGKSSCKHGERATRVRSILVFPVNISGHDDEKISRKTWKPFPLLRVLDIQGVNVVGFPKRLTDLIHLRYLRLRLRLVNVQELPLCFFDLKCLETVDLRCFGITTVVLPCKFHMLERLKHLYLQEEFEVEDDKKLRFPVTRMETLVNFDPKRCEIEDLQKMTRLRVFTIAEYFRFGKRDVHLLKGVLESPVMNKSGKLINSTRLQLSEELIYEQPTILSTLTVHPSCFKLSVYGFLDRTVIETDRSRLTVIELAHSLINVRLYGCELKGDLLLALEKLPHLKDLCVFNSGVPNDNKVSFSPDSFLQLKFLSFTCVENRYEEWEWEVGHGALINLQCLKLLWCKRLKKLPEGLPDSIQIECGPKCIRGIEKYGTCPHFKPQLGESIYY